MKVFSKKHWPHETLNVPSAWKGLESFLLDIIEQYGIEPVHALEIGVDFGYSSHIFSKLFDKVTGIDPYVIDPKRPGEQGDSVYQKTLKVFEGTNVELVKATFDEFVKTVDADTQYSLIHIDADHTYEGDLKMIKWALDHAELVIVHDTQSFAPVRKACDEVAKDKEVEFSNIVQHHGLGVFFKKSDKPKPKKKEKAVVKVEEKVEEVFDVFEPDAPEPAPTTTPKPRKKRASKKSKE